MSASGRPLIGVIKSDRGSLGADLWQDAAVRLAGGEPIAVTPRRPHLDAPVDGLILTGGAHIHPEHWGGEPIEGYAYDRPRDDLELDWLNRAREADLPVLAICRGAQMLNVAQGGTLHPDIRAVAGHRAYPGAGVWPALSFRKPITIEPAARLAQIVGGRNLMANALNTQALDAVGADLTVSAREANGMAQALEDPRRHFLLGVQFHPEFLLHRAPHRRIYKALTAAARDR